MFRDGIWWYGCLIGLSIVFNVHAIPEIPKKSLPVVDRIVKTHRLSQSIIRQMAYEVYCDRPSLSTPDLFLSLHRFVNRIYRYHRSYRKFYLKCYQNKIPINTMAYRQLFEIIDYYFRYGYPYEQTVPVDDKTLSTLYPILKNR